MQKTIEMKCIENVIECIKMSNGEKKKFYQNIYDIIKNYQSLHELIKEPETVPVKPITDENLNFIAYLANKHNGYIFGGSIRDSICNPDSSYNDIDIWFKTKQDFENFKVEFNQNLYSKILEKLSDSERKIFLLNISKNDEIKNEYPFRVHKLKYIFDNYLEKDIDCVVSEYFPVNDFTMNDLIYDGISINHFTFDDKLKKETINDILNKKTYMYHGVTIPSKRYDKFVERGWQIFSMERKEYNNLMYKKYNILNDIKSNVSKTYITEAIYKYIKNDLNINKNIYIYL